MKLYKKSIPINPRQPIKRNEIRLQQNGEISANLHITMPANIRISAHIVIGKIIYCDSRNQMSVI